MSLLEIQQLSVKIHSETGPEKILNSISLTIDSGQTVALVGESGSGKSVTALSLLRLLEHTATVSNRGKIIFEGDDILEMDKAALQDLRGNRIAMIFQEPMTSLNPVYTIGSQIMESLVLHQELDREEARKKTISLLSRTGIPDPETRFASYPHQLSGGQRQRVMIAMALACRPALLIADEPTTALDVTIQAQILELIRDVQMEYGMAVLLITHDLNMVRKIADHVHIMHRGRIVEHGPTESIFARPRNPYTIHLLGSIPTGTPEDKPEAPSLFTINNMQCHFAIKAGFLKKTVGSIRAVDGVSLTIRQGSTYGIVGESGSGKSTLGMCILRLVASQGQILYRTRENDEVNLLDYESGSMRPLRRELQVVFQDPFSSLSPRLTVERIISEGLTVHGIGANRKERRRLVEKGLIDVGLKPAMADRYPHEFSGGQRQRIAIARAVVLRPRFLVLDEPTSALDMTIQGQIIQLLRDLQKRYGITYLFISHDLRVIRAICDEVAVMQQGKVVESGPSAALFQNPTHPYTRQLFAAAFDLAVQAQPAELPPAWR